MAGRATMMGAMETIGSLERRLLGQGSDPRRLSTAQRIHDLGISHAIGSPERMAAGTALLKALGAENDPDAARKLEFMIRSLGFIVEAGTVRDAKGTIDGTPREEVVYSMSGPYPPRRRAVPKKQEPQKQRHGKEEPEEGYPIGTQPRPPTLEARPKRRRVDISDLGVRDPGAPDALPFRGAISVPLTQEDKRWIEIAKYRNIQPINQAGRAKKLVANLPSTSTEFGATAAGSLGIDELLRDAMTRVGTVAPRAEQVEIPRHVELATIAPGLPLWPPALVEQVKKWYEVANRNTVQETAHQTSELRVDQPSLSRISERYSVGPIDKYMLIATLDRPAGRRRREFAAALIAEFKVAEALPLLQAIIRQPDELNASRDLVELSAFAIFRIGGQAKEELRKDPALFAAAERLNGVYERTGRM